jgi:hypothetical protein
MAENTLDLSTQLTKEGVRLRNLTPENQSGILSEILSKLASVRKEGVMAIEAASTKLELGAVISKLVENVKTSPRHLDGQIAKIVDKLKDKDKYPDEEASAKALLEEGIAASEQGYLGYIARQKYETVARNLNWEENGGHGTAKEFLENYLAKNPPDANKVRQSLTTLDPDSMLECTLFGSHSRQSFENMMKKKWGTTVETTKKIEKNTDTQIIESLMGDVKLDEFNPDSDLSESNLYCVRQLQILQTEIVDNFNAGLDANRPILEQVKKIPHIAKLTKKDATFIHDWVYGSDTSDSPHDSSLEDIGKALRDLYAIQELLQGQVGFDKTDNPDTNCYKATKQINEELWPDAWKGNPPPLRINWEAINLDSAMPHMLGGKVFRHIALTQLPKDFH